MKGTQASFLTIGLILAWFVSPESLVIIDRGAGLAGMHIIVVCIVGVSLALICSLVIHDPALRQRVGGNDMVLLQRSFGRRLALALLLAGRVPILLFASTGMLVTAGFAFNEVFLYWFPNFLFASILLVAVALLNCTAEKIALSIQVIAVLGIAVGVVILIVLGSIGEAPVQQPVGMTESVNPLFLSAFGFLIFLGFDFHRLGGGSRPVILALVPAVVIVSLWVVTAVKYVEGEKLARSMIAYMTIARSVGGDTGHYLMAGIIICGVFGAVNGLFLAARRMLHDLVDENLFFSSKYAEIFYVGAIMLIIGVMMMAGVAGDQTLELQIRGAIILWMMYLGIKTIFAGRALLSMKRIRGLAGYAAGSVILLFSVIIGYFPEESRYIFSFVLLTAIATVLLSLIWVWMAGKPSEAISLEEDMP